jgi:hypothetical protein
MSEEKKMKVVFAEGCFDHFEGTQEELDEMIAMIQKAVDSGEIFEMGQELTDDEFNELPDEIKEQIRSSFGDLDEGESTSKRTLQ